MFVNVINTSCFHLQLLFAWQYCVYSRILISNIFLYFWKWSVCVTSVLGPLLFLIFINDLPVAVTSKTRLFADDCILYRQIYNHEDSITLQQDLDNLAAWEKMWGMQFHPEKCISLSVTRSQTPFHTSYILKGHTLESVTTAKYLGITISKDMNWDTHINNITSKVNKIIGFLR